MIRLTKVQDNLHRVTLGDLSLWFSYETIIAFQYVGERMHTSENIWSVTTGQHLATLDGGKVEGERNGTRLPRREFEARLADVVNRRPS